MARRGCYFQWAMRRRWRRAWDALMDEPEYRRRLGAQAERRMHEHFTREQAARAMGEIYQEFLERGSS